MTKSEWEISFIYIMSTVTVVDGRHGQKGAKRIWNETNVLL